MMRCRLSACLFRLVQDQIIQHVLLRGPLAPPHCGAIVLFGITAGRGRNDRKRREGVRNGEEIVEEGE
eukprot:1074744-Amorphochlora_amoeboformis.AAC.1